MTKKSSGPKKVLVVDDDPLVLRILKDKLAEAGFLVSTTSSAFGAIQQVEEQVPDVVIIDVMLPALPGNRIAALVRDRMRGKGVKVLLYSGRTAKELEVMVAESGADGYLVKSDRYDELVDTLNRIVS